MRFKGLDLNLLVALDALIAERNITRAGERIHLSQSGMSSAVSRLRQYFDDELFVLVGRNLTPTPLAEALAKPVRSILTDMENTVINRPEFNPARDERCYRISASELTVMVLMPKVINRLAEEAPKIHLELSRTTNAPQLLDNGDLDLIIIPRQFTLKDHPYDEIYQEDYKCICWEGNTSISDKITLDQFQQAGHVIVNYGEEQSPAFDGWFMNHYGYERKVEITTSNILAPPMLIPGTQRIATVHGRFARIASQTLPIKVLELPFDMPTLTQAVQYHRKRDNDAGLTWLRQIIAEEAKTI